MALSSQRLHVNSKGIVENVLYSLADNNPQQYATSFLRLAAWVDNSLDLYRVSVPPKLGLRLLARRNLVLNTMTFHSRPECGVAHGKLLRHAVYRVSCQGCCTQSSFTATWS